MKTTAKLLSILFLLTLIFSFTLEDEGDRLVGVWEPSSGKARLIKIILMHPCKMFH